MTRNRKLYITFSIIGYLTVILPVLIYNIVNYEMFTNISSTKLTFSFLIGVSMLGVALLTKMKHKGGWYTLLAGILLTFMGEASIQIGYSLLLIGLGLCLDNFIFHKLAIHYKEKYYGETGRQVTYTRNIE